MKLTLLLACWLGSTTAYAGSERTLEAGPEQITLSGTVTVPLLRGGVLGAVPAVEAALPVAGESEPRQVFVTLDVAYGWTRIGRDTVRSLGLTPQNTTLDKAWAQTVVLPELRIGEMVLTQVPAEVVAGEGLVLGVAAVPGLAVALQPSAGVVRFALGDGGEALVRGVGETIPMSRESRGKFKVNGAVRRARGVTRSVEGRLTAGSGQREGRVQIRTDLASSALTELPEGPSAFQRYFPETRVWNGERNAFLTARVDGVDLATLWVGVDEVLADPSGDLVGALGYDALYGVDLGVFPSRNLLALTPVATPKWSDPGETAVRLAKARWEAEEDPAEDEVYQDKPPALGFKAQEKANAEGELGDPARLLRAQTLGRALWASGKLDEALPYLLKATESAGDRCEPFLRLGEARLAWSGTMQEQPFIGELIQQPLRQAGELWDRWSGLTPAQREAARSGEGKPSGYFLIEQPVSCHSAWGLLMASYIQRGDTDAASAIYRERAYSYASSAYAQGLSLMMQQQWAVAEDPLRAALQLGGEYELDVRLALSRCQAERKMEEPVLAWMQELPGRETDHPLTAALLALESGYALGNGGELRAATAMVASNPYRPAVLLARRIVRGEADKSLDDALQRAELREAGGVSFEAMRAVNLALDGDVAGANATLAALRKRSAPTPDRTAAMAVVAHLSGDAEARDAAIHELRLRYPMIFAGQLGLHEDTFGRVASGM